MHRSGCTHLEWDGFLSEQRRVPARNVNTDPCICFRLQSMAISVAIVSVCIYNGGKYHFSSINVNDLSTGAECNVANDSE